MEPGCYVQVGNYPQYNYYFMTYYNSRCVMCRCFKFISRDKSYLKI